MVTREITEYSGGKREGPGELPCIENLAASSYSDKTKELTLRYLVWLEVTHALLLMPGWPGFNIKVGDRVVVVDSTISYLDTIDCPATDPEDPVQMAVLRVLDKRSAAVECCCLCF